MDGVRVSLKLEASRDFFSRRIEEIQRVFVGVSNKTIIPLALVGYEMIIANSANAPRWLSTISYPTRPRGIIVR